MARHPKSTTSQTERSRSKFPWVVPGMIRPKTEADQLFSDCLSVFYARFYCPPDEALARFEALAEQGYLRRETQGKMHGFAIAPNGYRMVIARNGHGA